MIMEELVAKLNEASEAYYNGKEMMTNKEFDSLLDELKDMEKSEGRVLPNSPTIKVGFAPVDSLPKFTHTYPALSLDKTKNIDEFEKAFYKGIEASGDNNDGVVLMWKLDGSTVQAYYKDRRLQHLVTRGNGEVGSDITHNARAISGIPITIPMDGEVVVRGEALMSYDDFRQVNDSLPEGEERYKNPRNLAASTIQMKDPNEVKDRNVIVKAFNLVKIDDSFTTFSQRLKILKELGFNVVEHHVCSVADLKQCVETMSSQVSDYCYPVDGLVAAMDNYEYASKLVGTEHHPHIMQGYAFKWADETEKTTIREIEWSPSRTGLLNPVAIFDPVDLEGTTVKRASLHNLSIMRSMRIHVGDRIAVYKSNKIIPYVDENLDYDNEQDYTDEFIEDLIGCCPTCKTHAIAHKSSDGIETVYCPNESCPEKMIGKLAHFCERDCMDIQGMSEETIKKLVDAGFIKEYSDFFLLDQKPGISFLPGFGKQSWKKMCDAASNAKTTTFVRFLTSLSIPNIGKGQVKTLVKYLIDNYVELCNFAKIPSDGFNLPVLLSYLGCYKYDFAKIDGFGDIMSAQLTEWLDKHFNLPSDVWTPELNVCGMLAFTDKPKSASESPESAISGKSFCITGKLIYHTNRPELVAKIESAGGRYVDSVSSKTDYLINNDVTSTSGKNAMAHNLNIPIISEQDFLNMLS